MNKRPSQCVKVLDYMQKHGSITQREANTLGIMRLASRISELRKKGYEFTVDTIPVRNKDGEVCRIARYSLA